MAGTGSGLVEPWADFQGQTEPGWSLAAPQPQHTCGQLPVSIGAPAPGISSCLHHNHPSWAPDSTSQNPSEALILFTVPACAHTPHILVYTSQRCVDPHGPEEPTNIQLPCKPPYLYIHSLSGRQVPHNTDRHTPLVHTGRSHKDLHLHWYIRPVCTSVLKPTESDI